MLELTEQQSLALRNGQAVRLRWADFGEDVVVLREGLAEAEGEDDLAVGQMRDDFEDAPLALGGRSVDLSAGHAGG